MEQLKTCGFGYKNNLGPTTSNFDSFFKNGTANSSNLTKNASNCLNQLNVNFGLYNQPNLQRFGKAKFKLIKGTKGSFTRWCKSKGYPKVTTACINRGKKSKSLVTRKRAIFAQNIRKVSFGKKNYKNYNFYKKKSTLKNTLNDINYLKKL